MVARYQGGHLLFRFAVAVVEAVAVQQCRPGVVTTTEVLDGPEGGITWSSVALSTLRAWASLPVMDQRHRSVGFPVIFVAAYVPFPVSPGRAGCYR